MRTPGSVTSVELARSIRADSGCAAQRLRHSLGQAGSVGVIGEAVSSLAARLHGREPEPSSSSSGSSALVERGCAVVWCGWLLGAGLPGSKRRAVGEALSRAVQWSAVAGSSGVLLP